MFKWLVTALLSIGLLVACSEREPSVANKQTYPWQIEITANGNSRVFGVSLDESKLIDAAQALQKRYELGLFENRQGKLTLEAYFREISRGGLSGKLIATLKVDEALLKSMKQNNVKAEHQESGEIRYRLSNQDQQLARELTVYSLSYIPYINLDQEMIAKRFGTADKVIKISDTIEHHVFPATGLDIRLDTKGKELLQYVSPRHSRELLEPLVNRPQNDKATQ